MRNKPKRGGDTNGADRRAARTSLVDEHGRLIEDQLPERPFRHLIVGFGKPTQVPPLMAVLVLGLILFLGIHSVSIVAPAWRDTQVELRGERVWKGLYGLASLAALLLVVYGYGAARQTPMVLYAPPTALRHVALLLMLPVFPLLFAAYLPGRIQRAAKHPMLLAVILWSIAHLVANGTGVDVVLFGAFLIWAVADWISVSHRAVPHRVPGAPPGAFNDIAALSAGLVVYLAFLFWAHAWLVGVSPLG